jgi:hypothetical protein
MGQRWQPSGEQLAGQLPPKPSPRISSTTPSIETVKHTEGRILESIRWRTMIEPFLRAYIPALRSDYEDEIGISSEFQAIAVTFIQFSGA